MICADEFVWWDLKGNKRFYGIFFFQVIWKIHSILKSKEKTLSNSDEQKAHNRKMKFPCFLLDLEKWPVFRYYNIIFHFHEASVWNCLSFQRLVLKLDNEWFYFFRIVMYWHYTHKQKRYKYQRTRKAMRGNGRTKLNLQLFQCYMDECLVYGP